MNNIKTKDKIRHQGVVDAVSGGHVRVRIVQTSACASCRVAGSCNASESKERVVDVFGAAREGLKVGDEVVVWASRGAVAHAMLLGFGLPFALMVAVLFCVTMVSGDELKGALAAVASLAPYFFCLWLMRDRIRGRVSFFID